MSLLQRVKRLQRCRRYENINIEVMFTCGTITRKDMELTFPAYMKNEYKEGDLVYPLTGMNGITYNGKGQVIEPIVPRLKPEQVKARCFKTNDKSFNNRSQKVDPDDYKEEEELKEIFEEYPGQWNSTDDLKVWIEDNMNLFTKEEITERDQIINIKPKIY